MKVFSSKQVSESCSDNLASKTCTELGQSIENPKLLRGTMKIILRLIAISLTLVCGSAIADAQQAGKIFRIGFLDPSTASSTAVLVDAFRQELRKLGWADRRACRQIPAACYLFTEGVCR
jgi:hypothetical protein